nr:hypothetical protein [Paenibacillus xylanexedens]
MEEASNYEFTPHELAIREQNKGRFIIGNPEQVKTQIQKLERTALIDEIMVADFYADQRTRLKGYTLFAELMNA